MKNFRDKLRCVFGQNLIEKQDQWRHSDFRCICNCEGFPLRRIITSKSFLKKSTAAKLTKCALLCVFGDTNIFKGRTDGHSLHNAEFQCVSNYLFFREERIKTLRKLSPKMIRNTYYQVRINQYIIGASEENTTFDLENVSQISASCMWLLGCPCEESPAHRFLRNQIML